MQPLELNVTLIISGDTKEQPTKPRNHNLGIIKVRAGKIYFFTLMKVSPKN